MEIVTVVLAVAAVLKLIAIAGAIRWLAASSVEDRNALRTASREPIERLDVLQEMKPDFFPFGLKDYKLR